MGKIKGIVKAISGPNKHEGVMQIGFLLEGVDNWHNIQGEEKLLKEMLEKMIKKGAELEFDEDANKNITNLKLIKEAPKKEGKWEDDMVTFEDLLTKAHGLKKPFSIRTERLEVNLEKKYALFKAIVIVDDGMPVARIFEAHGDATQENVTGTHIKPHFIRMAETRAIVRALRWYTNNGCAEEEK